MILARSDSSGRKAGRWHLAALLVLGSSIVFAAAAFAPGRAFAEFTIPMAATSAGGGEGTDGQFGITYTIGQGSPVGTTGFGPYRLASGIMAALSDIEPPAIIHVPGQLVAARTAVEISADITDPGTGIDTVIVFFREGGTQTFREKPMLKTIGTTYAAILPPSSVTERGLAYYIEAIDNVGNRGWFPAGAPESLLTLGIYFSNLAATFELPAGKYRMISVPGVPTNADPDSVLGDDLGAYDPQKWRLGRWNGARTGCSDDCYDEYPASGSVSPGRGFWLISSEARTFDLTGTATDIAHPFDITLARGWNQVGAPFGFPADWLVAQVMFDTVACAIGQITVVGSDTILVEDNLVAYDGAYQPFQSQLVPWAGYWVYNASTADVDLRLDPRPTADVLASGAGPSRDVRQSGGSVPEVAINLLVRSDRFPASTALAGLSPVASDGWDPMDLHEPPSIGDHLRCVFNRSDWGARSGLYMSDVRRSGADGATWQFLVECSGRERASLDLAVTGALPGSWQVCLYDLEAGIRVDARDLPHAFEVNRSRPFALVAGTPAFVAAQESSGTFDLRPRIISTTPNPFSDKLAITYFLPAPGRAELKVFSVEGRLVGAIPTSQAAGRATAAWDGRSLRGEPAAPGIYFVQLETGDARLVRKVLKVK